MNVFILYSRKKRMNKKNPHEQKQKQKKNKQTDIKKPKLS